MNHIVRLTLLFSTLALVSACSKTAKTDFFGVEEEAKAPKVVTSTKLARNWSINLGSKISKGDAIISPALLGDSVYAASTNGRVVKIEAATGKRIWQKSLDKTVITAGVSVGSGLVLVATEEGKVIALNQSNGEVSWETKLSTEILASPAVGGDVVVARTGDGKVYGISSYNGEIQWTISRQLPKLTLRGESKPLIFQGVVFAGFADGTLAAIEAKNGRALWDFPISFARGTNEIDRLSDVDTDPLLVGDYIYVSSYQEITHALNIATQRIEWSADVSSFHTLDYDTAYLYISDKQGVVHKIDRADGSKVWSQQGLRLFSVSAPISVGPYVAVADGDGNFYLMNKRDGSYAGKHKLGAKAIVGQPVVDSDTVIFIDSDGKLQSLSIVNS